MMSIRFIIGVSLLVAMCGMPTQTVHAQRHGSNYDRAQVVECRSDNYRRAYCRVNWRDARLVGQVSSTPCRRGQNWGFSRGAIWVDGGCAGRFAEVGSGHRGQRGWNPPSGWNHRFDVRCASNDYQYNFCAVDLGHGGSAHLRRQISDSACVKGRTWGSNRAGIWVTQGCEGVFTIDRRWR